MGRNYWMVVGSPENFEITKELGFTLHGVGRKYRRRAQRMHPDDRVLYYVTGTRKWTAIATITSHSFEDHTPVWKSNGREDGYPFRVKMAPEIVLDEEDCIDALILAPRLEYVKHWAPEDWPLAFYGTLHLLPQRDFRLIESEMKRNLSKRRKAKGAERPEETGDRPAENPIEAVGQARTGERSGETDDRPEENPSEAVGQAQTGERPEETDDRPEENPSEAVGQAQTGERPEETGDRPEENLIEAVGQAQTGERSEEIGDWPEENPSEAVGQAHTGQRRPTTGRKRTPQRPSHRHRQARKTLRVNRSPRVPRRAPGGSCRRTIPRRGPASPEGCPRFPIWRRTPPAEPGW